MKIHYAINRGQAICNTRGKNIYITPYKDKVTCKKCLTKLILNPELDNIEEYKPTFLLTGRCLDIKKLTGDIGQVLIKNNMIEEALEMHQMVNKVEYLDDVLVVFEQYVKLK